MNKPRATPPYRGAESRRSGALSARASQRASHLLSCKYRRNPAAEDPQPPAVSRRRRVPQGHPISPGNSPSRKDFFPRSLLPAEPAILLSLALTSPLQEVACARGKGRRGGAATRTSRRLRCSVIERPLATDLLERSQVRLPDNFRLSSETDSKFSATTPAPWNTVC